MSNNTPEVPNDIKTAMMEFARIEGEKALELRKKREEENRLQEKALIKERKNQRRRYLYRVKKINKLKMNMEKDLLSMGYNHGDIEDFALYYLEGLEDLC